MHRLISSLVATHLLLHVIAGCCWHHGHAGCAARHGAGPQVAANHAACDSHDGHRHVPDEQSHHHEHQLPCEQPDCVFPLAPVQRTADDFSPVAMAWLIDEAPQCLAISTTDLGNSFDASDGLAAALPVRRHLLFSTLLI